MSENCSHDCSNCASSSGCASKIEKEKTNQYSHIKKVYAVMSGKGGVGKSLVTSMLAVLNGRSGKKTAILDADITGPSIPKMFGAEVKAMASEEGIFPVLSGSGIEIMSINSLLENASDPVVWRGPVIAGAVKQFWTDVLWNEVDTMFIDCPPGTGDVPLTILQSLPVDGIIFVTSPQDLVNLIVEKAVKMAEMMNIPVIGIVENMSYFVCDNCDKKHYIFGESKVKEIAKAHGIKYSATLPLDQKIRVLADEGRIEFIENEDLSELVKSL